MSPTLLTPIGSTSVDHLASNVNAYIDGTVRLSHTTGATSVAASNTASIAATTVTLPSSSFTSSGTALAGTLTVAGAVSMQNANVASLTASTKITTNVVNSSGSTIGVTTGKVILNANVQVTGAVEKASSSALSVVDNILEIGAVNNAGVAVTSVSDAARDGAAIVVPGVPDYLPSGASASSYKHAFQWKINSGDFNSDGSAVAPQLQPMWEMVGGVFAIAAPDTTGRQSRFLFSPILSSSEASLGIYYTVGTSATLVMKMGTTPLS